MTDPIAQMRARIFTFGEQTEGDALRQRIAQLQAEAKQAIAAFERGSSRLYVRSRPSGKKLPRFAEEQMKELLCELNAARNTALRAIERAAEPLVAEAVRAQELAEQFPPDAVLSGSERSAVAERMALVERGVASLRDVELESRLRGVLGSGSKVDQYVYWTAARNRARATRERQAREARASGQANASEAVRGTPFDGVLAEIEDRLLG